MVLQSQIKKVTVYSDRALVERIATMNLTSGEHTLIFESLPHDIDTNSIQIGGGQKCILQEIKAKTIHLNEIPDEKKKELYDEIEQLEIQGEEINDKLENLNQEKLLLQKLTEFSTESPKKGIAPLLVPEKVSEILSFYADKMDKIDNDIRTFTRKQVKLNDHLKKLTDQSNAYNNKSLKIEKQVEVKVFVLEDAEQILNLSYIVMHASWKPIYDFRLGSEDKMLNISYNAIITQKTGEKWENVQLGLSTARPQISAIQPNLRTWFIDVFNPSPPPSPSPKMKKAAMPMALASVSDEFYEEKEEVQRSSMPMVEAKVETGASAVNFSIPGTHTIIDNNEEHKIGITVLNFDSDLEYNAVPKLSPFAYLTATTTNNSNFPMLAGSSNIFLDNSFVTTSAIKLVAPNQEFKTSLGVDESIHIEHKLVNKFSKDEGLFSKKSKIVYEYHVDIANNKKIESIIVIKDQIPISQNQEIKVELIEPKYKEDTPNLKKSDEGIIEWKLKLKPSEKIQLVLKFSIEFPREIELSGLGF